MVTHQKASERFVHGFFQSRYPLLRWAWNQWLVTQDYLPGIFRLLVAGWPECENVAELVPSVCVCVCVCVARRGWHWWRWVAHTATRLKPQGLPPSGSTKGTDHRLCMVGVKAGTTLGRLISFLWERELSPFVSFLKTVIEILDSLRWKSHLTTSRLEAVIFVKVYFNQRKSCFPSSTGNSPEMHGCLRSAVRIQALFNLRIKIFDVYKVY